MVKVARGGLAEMGLHKHHPFYLAWCNMKTRCDNPKSTQYKWYGARGISYCIVWKDFMDFYLDMFQGWKYDLMLDRKHNDKDYSKENCRWVTPKENANNRSSSRITQDLASSIRNLYKTGEYTQKELAQRFDVSQPYISDIITHQAWE